MDERDTPNILAVGARLANLARAKATGPAGADGMVAGAALAEVDSARGAFELMRALPFDLIAIGTDVTDMTPECLARRLQATKPWQKWVMVANDVLGQDDEVTLRSLGAVAILDGPDAWQDVVEVARTLRRKRPEMTVPGWSLKPAALEVGRA